MRCRPLPFFFRLAVDRVFLAEMNNRMSFIDFVQGLLNMNPIERWSPQQARLHPFITGEKWTKPWTVSHRLLPRRSTN